MADDIQVRLSAEWGAAVASGRTPEIAGVRAAAAPELASRAAAVAELEETRLLVAGLRESLETRRDEQRLVTRQWTIRDVVGHLASWARETRCEIETLGRGQTFDYTIHFEREGGPRAWNQREIDARVGRSVWQLFDEFDAETSRLAELAVSLSEDEFQGRMELPRTSGEPPSPWRLGLAPLLVQTCWHVRYHLTAIERARSRA